MDHEIVHIACVRDFYELRNHMYSTHCEPFSFSEVPRLNGSKSR